MEKNYTVVDVVSISPEVAVYELGEPALGANVRGGLGIRIGDDGGAFPKVGIKGIIITLFYQRHWLWLTGEQISYGQTPAQYVCDLELLGINFLDPKHPDIKTKVWKISRGGTDVYGIESPEVLYVTSRDWRFLQEVILGHGAVALLKKLKIKPKIVWFQEGHTAVAQPLMEEDPYFKDVKFLFTTHTPVPEGMETFDAGRFDQMKLTNPEKYRKRFIINHNSLNMTRGLMVGVHLITAVSDEHEEVTKNKVIPALFHDPEEAQKIAAKVKGVMNGSSRDIWLSPRIKAIEKNITPLTLWEACQLDVKDLVECVNRELTLRGIKERFDPLTLTLAFVRRFAWYKQQHPTLAPIIPAICAPRGKVVRTDLGDREGLGVQVFMAGRAHESDSRCRQWMDDFERWVIDPDLRGKVLYLPDYSMLLRQMGVWGCHVWLSCPLPEWEAGGTSDEIGAMNSKINLATRAGDIKKYGRQYNPVTGKGNCFFIDPYYPNPSEAVYEQLKLISDLYYAWVEKGDPRWPNLMMNAYRTGKGLDITIMMRKYKKLFEQLLK